MFGSKFMRCIAHKHTFRAMFVNAHNEKIMLLFEVCEANGSKICILYEVHEY